MNANHGVPPGPAATPMMNGMHGSHLVGHHIFYFYLISFIMHLTVLPFLSLFLTFYMFFRFELLFALVTVSVSSS